MSHFNLQAMLLLTTSDLCILMEKLSRDKQFFTVTWILNCGNVASILYTQQAMVNCWHAAKCVATCE